jgi:hypothetical protein
MRFVLDNATILAATRCLRSAEGYTVDSEEVFSLLTVVQAILFTDEVVLLRPLSSKGAEKSWTPFYKNGSLRDGCSMKSRYSSRLRRSTTRSALEACIRLPTPWPNN